MSRIATGLRSPRPAVQGVVWHRHFKIDGDGYLEHAHAVVKRDHEHLYTRLGRVMLTWTDHEPVRPRYEREDDTPAIVGYAVVGLIFLAFLASVWPW